MQYTAHAHLWHNTLPMLLQREDDTGRRSPIRHLRANRRRFWSRHSHVTWNAGAKIVCLLSVSSHAALQLTSLLKTIYFSHTCSQVLGNKNHSAIGWTSKHPSSWSRYATRDPGREQQGGNRLSLLDRDLYITVGMFEDFRSIFYSTCESLFQDGLLWSEEKKWQKKLKYAWFLQVVAPALVSPPFLHNPRQVQMNLRVSFSLKSLIYTLFAS